VSPLIVEALNDNRISVGRPYFDRMTMPIGMALLFLMAVAPILPWRKASGELLQDRLRWPAIAGVATIVICVALGVRGLAPLLAFGLGAFAAGAALRQLALATRANGWRGLVGRTNGGMIVHLGVVVVAIALAASSSYARGDELRLQEGESGTVAGHEITYLGIETSRSDQKTVTKARVRVDGGKVYAPALNRFPNATQQIPTPSVKWGLREDVYLTLVAGPSQEGGAAVISVIVEPLVSWLWIGGGIMGFGTLLSAWPGRRRRPDVTATSSPAAAAPPAEDREPVGVA
jgi:cytochrome c-type biogenesis protein CcmF